MNENVPSPLPCQASQKHKMDRKGSGGGDMDTASIGRNRAVRTNRHIGRLLLRVNLSLVALSLLWTFLKSASATESAATTTVLVYNNAHVSPGILSAAEREAGRILDAAGVGMIWVECPTGSATAGAVRPCSATLKSTDIMLRVLPPPAQRSLRGFGFAISSNLASVYYDDAVRLAVEEEYVEFDARIILGCVIAHELGHLLLGSNSHSSAGIMQSPWGRKQVQQALMGTLLFTAEQAEVMRAEARDRTELQMSNSEGAFVGTAEQSVDQQPRETAKLSRPATVNQPSKRRLASILFGFAGHLRRRTASLWLPPRIRSWPQTLPLRWQATGA